MSAPDEHQAAASAIALAATTSSARTETGAGHESGVVTETGARSESRVAPVSGASPVSDASLVTCRCRGPTGYLGRCLERAAGRGHAARQPAAAWLDGHGRVLLHHRAARVHGGRGDPRAERRCAALLGRDYLHPGRADRGMLARGTTTGREGLVRMLIAAGIMLAPRALRRRPGRWPGTRHRCLRACRRCRCRLAGLRVVPAGDPREPVPRGPCRRPWSGPVWPCWPRSRIRSRFRLIGLQYHVSLQTTGITGRPYPE
jgi:hypothetical protein